MNIKDSFRRWEVYPVINGEAIDSVWACRGWQVRATALRMARNIQGMHNAARIAGETRGLESWPAVKVTPARPRWCSSCEYRA